MTRIDRLLDCVGPLSRSLSAFVSRYGVAEAIASGSGPPTVAIGDFFHYCVAKGSKHIRAAIVLLDHGFPEDAIVLSRAAYECYVSAAYAEAQGVKAIDDLVYNTVGLGGGTVEYVRKTGGGWNYRRLVDKETGTFYDAPPSIERMIKNTKYPEDAFVHRGYYGFSSEHAHVNMSGSGNYRNGASYTDRGNAQKPNAAFLLAYVAVILLGQAIATPDKDEREKSRVKEEIRVAINNIYAALTDYFESPAEEFVQAVRARLNRLII